MPCTSARAAPLGLGLTGNNVIGRTRVLPWPRKVSHFVMGDLYEVLIHRKWTKRA